MPKLYAILVYKLLQKRINVNVAKTIYALFKRICRVNDLRAGGRGGRWRADGSPGGGAAAAEEIWPEVGQLCSVTTG